MYGRVTRQSKFNNNSISAAIMLQDVKQEQYSQLKLKHFASHSEQITIVSAVLLNVHFSNRPH